MIALHCPFSSNTQAHKKPSKSCRKDFQSREERKLRQYKWEVRNADMQPAPSLPFFFKHPSSQEAVKSCRKHFESREERKLRQYEYKWEVRNADMQPAQLITQEFDCSSLPLFFKHPSSQEAINILHKGLQNLAERTFNQGKKGSSDNTNTNGEVRNADMQPAQLITQEFDCSSLPLFFKHPSSQKVVKILQKGLSIKGRKEAQTIQIQMGGPQC